MKTLKQKINKINKKQPLLSIEEVMRLMEEFYDKYDGEFDMPSINFLFENDDYLQMFIKIDRNTFGGFPIWYIIITCVNETTSEVVETEPMLVWDDAYTLIKECIGNNVLDSKIKHIEFTL